jgi:hypothetical protein
MHETRFPCSQKAVQWIRNYIRLGVDLLPTEKQMRGTSGPALGQFQEKPDRRRRTFVMILSRGFRTELLGTHGHHLRRVPVARPLSTATITIVLASHYTDGIGIRGGYAWISRETPITAKFFFDKSFGNRQLGNRITRVHST